MIPLLEKYENSLSKRDEIVLGGVYMLFRKPFLIATKDGDWYGCIKLSDKETNFGTIEDNNGKKFYLTKEIGMYSDVAIKFRIHNFPISDKSYKDVYENLQNNEIMEYNLFEETQDIENIMCGRSDF